MEVAEKDACLEDTDDQLESASSDSDNSEDKSSRGELREMLVPAVLKESWINELEKPIHLNSYYIEFCPVPEDRIYKQFGLFLKAPLPLEAERMNLDLHLARGRSVMTKLVPSGLSQFNADEITHATNFQEMFLKVILDRSEFVHEFVSLGKDTFSKSCPTFYLLLPVNFHGSERRLTVDWESIRRCLSSPVFKNPGDVVDMEPHSSDACLQLANGRRSIRDVENSLVYTPRQKFFYFITDIVPEKNGSSPSKGSTTTPSHMDHLTTTHIGYPGRRPRLRAKQLFSLRNLLCNQRKGDSKSEKLGEHFVDLAPELCELKIIGFSKDFGSSISLLPSIMHRLENLLVAIELKCMLSASFSEGDKVTANRVLEALTTEECQENLSLERLETLGDAFLKFTVGRYFFLLHDTADEDELTSKRKNAVSNSNLYKLASRNNLQVYIRDQPFNPRQFFALGRPCPRICTKDSEATIHSQCGSHASGKAKGSEVRCSKGHHWLYKGTVSDVVEALAGAFLVDSGFKATIAFLRWIGIEVDFDDAQVINICQASNTYATIAPSMDIATLENLLGHQFLYKGLLLQAFVHPSSRKNAGGCYQRLEFLGDAVLDFLVTSYLFSVYPKLKPRHFTDLRSALVNNRAFAGVAVDRSLYKYLICDSNALSAAIIKFVDFIRTPESERNLLERQNFPKVLGDLVESSVGAILLDTGLDLNRVWEIMLSFLDPITSFSNLQINPVKELTELCQSPGWESEVTESKNGRTFSVDVKLSGKDMDISASASNSNKTEATIMASEQIFARLKDQGLIPKTHPLEDLLRNTEKMEAKLIGYDETPIDVAAPYVSGVENLKIHEPFDSYCSSEVRDSCPPCFKADNALSASPLGFSGSLSSETTTDLRCDKDVHTTGKLDRGTAISRLHEICTANCWKAPLFECCTEEGPSHLKSFTYKVVVEIEEAPAMKFECFGSPRMKKKAAAEDAAEGALWYLKNQGYLF